MQRREAVRLMLVALVTAVALTLPSVIAPAPPLTPGRVSMTDAGISADAALFTQVEYSSNVTEKYVANAYGGYFLRADGAAVIPTTGVTELGAAISAAFGAGIKIVIASPTTYWQNTTVTLPEGGLLVLAGATARLGANVNAYSITRNATLLGGVIDTSQTTYTSTAVLFNAATNTLTNDISWHARAQGQYLLGGVGDGTGKAIELRADTNTGTSYVYGAEVLDIKIVGYQYGIYLKRQGPTSGYINGNLFDGIWARQTRNFIYFDTDTAGSNLNGNLFEYVDYQTTTETVSGITLDGSYNRITCRIWDWPTRGPGGSGITLTSQSKWNVISTGLLQANITDLGSHNVFEYSNDGILEADYIQLNNGVRDANGADVLGVTTISSAVNYVKVANAGTGSSPSLNAFGTDAAVSLRLSPQGTGLVRISDGVDITKRIGFDLSAAATGTSSSTFALPFSASRTITFPDATTTLVGRDTTDTLTNKILTNPKVNTILDVNGGTILGIGANPTPANYLKVNSAAAGGQPFLSVDGSDTDISMRISPKGTGVVRITDGTDTTKRIGFSLTGAGTGTNSLFVLPFTSARTVTFQDATGTVPLLGATQTWTGTNTFAAVSASSVTASGAVTAGSLTVNGDLTLNKKIVNGAITQTATSVGVTNLGEPDTAYGVSCSANFNAGSNLWITSKATTGFTVNWVTAAPAGATFDCMVYR